MKSKVARDSERTAAERRLSARMVLYIRDVITRRGLSRTAARRLLGLGPKGYADLMESEPREIDPEPLFRHLIRLGVNVTVYISKTPDGQPGRTTLTTPRRPRRSQTRLRQSL